MCFTAFRFALAFAGELGLGHRRHLDRFAAVIALRESVQSLGANSLLFPKHLLIISAVEDEPSIEQRRRRETIDEVPTEPLVTVVLVQMHVDLIQGHEPYSELLFTAD